MDKVLKVLGSYSLEADGVPATIDIQWLEHEFVPRYLVRLPNLEEATRAILEEVENHLLTQTSIKFEETLDVRTIEKTKQNFKETVTKILQKELPHLTTAEFNILTGFLVHDMLGLGTLEILLNDADLEEIVINEANAPLWVYHKKFGWLKTNVQIPTEQQINNYASIIGRRVGRQITVLTPLMDAHLVTGDRVNATLFPISSKGNTVTIRKFRRMPWTITDLIKNRTINPEIASLLWLSLQYELSVLVSGGTGSGKTTFLNCLLTFVHPNHRIISIEDTRELNLPEFLHWVPMTTREPNQEGKGEITMLDLMVNSLRMRPDRIIVGEIRRQREAEVLFEAMHTGHSVYSTLHADTADQTIRRMTTPPINIPSSMLQSLDLVVTMFRDRRQGIRRVSEVAELIPETEGDVSRGVKPRVLYRWKPRQDVIEPYEHSLVLFDKLSMHTGMSADEIDHDLKEKQVVLSWLVNQNVTDIHRIGWLIGKYYTAHSELMDAVLSNQPAETMEAER